MLSWTLSRLARSPEALAGLRKATALAEGLLADEPGSAAYRTLLAQALTQSGNLLLKEGQTAEALPMLRRGVEIIEATVRDEPAAVFHKRSLSSSLRGVGRAEAAAGHHAEASAAFERASKIDLSLAGIYPNERYNLACSLALMIPVSEPDRREALAVQSMEALRQSMAAGYANVESIKKDPDLDSLRPRADFQSFVTGIQAKAVSGR
jgi:serine/threonine-protein kinase